MDSNRKENSFAALALAFVIGGLIGATGLGLLLVPRTGRETREKIKEGGGESLEKPQDTVEDIWAEGKGLAEAEKEKIKEGGGESLEKPQDTVEDICTECKGLAEAEKEKALSQIRYSTANIFFQLAQETRRQVTLLQFPQAQSSGRRKPKTETLGDWLKPR